MQANLTRVADLTSEIRRQLTPLGRQAEVARRAQAVQADVRDARARLLADELAQLTATLEAEIADETALRRRRAEVEAALGEARTLLAGLERDADEAAPRLSALAETAYLLGSLAERLRGTGTLAAERVRLLGTAADGGSDAPDDGLGGGSAAGRRDPDDLAAQAARVRDEERALAGETERLAEHLTAGVAAREEAEAALHAEDRRVAAVARAAADRREGLARLGGQVGARRSRIEAAEAEIGRLREALADAGRRTERAQGEYATLEQQVAGAEQGEEGLDAEHEGAAAALEAAEAEVARWADAERTAERDRDTYRARKEALELGLDRKDGAGVLLAAGARLGGVLGTVAALLEVRPGSETALAAALGSAADAVAVDSVDAAVDALRLLKDTDGGSASLVVGGLADPAPESGPHAGPLPEGCEPAADHVTASDDVATAVRALLRGHVVVDGLALARRVVADRPDLVAVTVDGDVLAAGHARGGSASSPSLLQVQAAVDEAAAALADAVRCCERARFAGQRAAADRDTARDRVDAALERLHESDARLSAVAEQLGQLAATVRGAAAEAERVERSRAAAQDAARAERALLDELVERLRVAEAEPDSADPDTTGRDRLAAAAAAARSAETEQRLALRTGEERLRALTGRAESLERAAATERDARRRAAERAQRRRRQSEVAAAVRAGAEVALAVCDRALRAATEQRDAAEAEHTGRRERTTVARRDVDAYGEELARLTDSVHADEVARAEQRLRVEALRSRSVDELGTDPDVLVEEYGPHQPVPPSPPPSGASEPAEPAAPTPYVRDEQLKRLRAGERVLNQLGKVNPLALEEFAALEERHTFLVEQLRDLERSRSDLLDIVREVDERVQQVFAAAYADVAAQFEGVFSRLFPGGEGRLVLTDPDDMLTTGIEVEARPAGKKVKRLSLLSGGERSLTAVALLVSIFKARPSPFYVLDEVEAALDDTNLGRLLTIITELRDSSQLIVITHQKRTMEVADALYGVSMRQDGVTTVVSQRLREEQPA